MWLVPNLEVVMAKEKVVNSFHKNGKTWDLFKILRRACINHDRVSSLEIHTAVVGVRELVPRWDSSEEEWLGPLGNLQRFLELEATTLELSPEKWEALYKGNLFAAYMFVKALIQR